jgi:hypothetical protein
MFGGHQRGVPRVAGIALWVRDECELETFRVAECQSVLVVGILDLTGLDPAVREVLLPPADGRLRYRERRRGGLAGAVPAAGRVRPREEGHQRSRPSGLVAVVEVICAGIVEVDGGLHQPQPERPKIEVGVPLWVAANGGDVVQATGLDRHDISLRLGVPS